MLCLIACLTLFSCVLSSASSFKNSHDGSILNGVDSSIQAHPYQVSLQDGSGKHFCGGSIYKEDIIITAAHCINGHIFGSTRMKVRLGSNNCRTGGELVDVADIRVHEHFNLYSFENDVALIKLAKPVNQTNKVRYIHLANETPKTGAAAIVTGWGAKSDILQRFDINIMDWQLCGSNKYRYSTAIKSNMVCATANKKDGGQNDSGGPLVYQGELVGVVSFGNKGFADPEYPGVFTDVSKLRDWIDRNVAELKAV